MSKSLIRFVLTILTAPIAIGAFVDKRQTAWSPEPLTIYIRVVDTATQPTAIVGGVFHKRRAGFAKSFSLPELTGRKARDLKLVDSDGKPIGFRELAEGEYLAEKEIESWSYALDLSPSDIRNSAAHKSWLSGETGILMMRDFWPRVEGSSDKALLNLTVPAGWSVMKTKATGTSLTPLPKASSGDWYGASSKSVFLIGKSWRQHTVAQEPTGVVALTGEWKFTDLEASELAGEVLTEYKKRLGPLAALEVQVAITKFPTNTPLGHWQAETRGSNVTIVSSDMPFRAQSLQRLHEQLRHELFHLWIPNGVNLTGNYDWFYEGFALYQSLKLAVGLNRIRFEDFLDTLSRAHTIESAQPRRPSLIEASKARFDGTNNTQVYARGMLVAFLVDLVMLENTKGKRSVEDLLSELYRNHKTALPTDANAAVTEMFRTNGAGRIVDRYVSGSDKIDWANELSAAGISDTDAGPITTLKVSEKLSGRQKTMLDKLGYNNWRKLSRDSK